MGEYRRARRKKMRVHIIQCRIDTVWAVVVVIGVRNSRWGKTHISHLSVPICHVLRII
jgi:t-SNARE complex subunit (syntaxin)